MNNSDVLCKLRMLCSLVSCTICVQYCTTKHIGLQLSGHIWQRCNNSNILHYSTDSIRAMYRMILQPFVPCMEGSALGCWHVYRTVPLKKYWFVYFTACIRLHIGLQALNQSDMCLWHPLPPPIRTLSVCRGSLAGSVLQGVGSWGPRQPRRPAAGEWVSGWSACSWGLLSSQSFAWFMWEMLYGPGLKAAGGVEGRDVEKDYYHETAVMLLALWGNAGLSICSLCCASRCKLDVLTVQHRSVVRLDLLWIDKC